MNRNSFGLRAKAMLILPAIPWRVRFVPGTIARAMED